MATRSGKSSSSPGGRAAGAADANDHGPCGAGFRRLGRAPDYDPAVRVPERFLHHVRTSGLLPVGTRVLVACSGGADSTALLRLLARLARPLGLAEVAVAHLDHGLRADSPEDARFVAALAEELGLRAVVGRRKVTRRADESPEAAARRVRYAFLARAAARLRCDVVVTAHQLDDQAETVLYRVLRGTTLEGLRGVAPATEIAGVRVVRPLLPFRREELREWLTRQRQPWREDPTNEGGNDRARIRAEVLPLVRRLLRRDAAEPLARLADAARAACARHVADEPATSPSRPRPRRRPS
jgi:tRNA(Ile)-lysidine synthase